VKIDVGFFDNLCVFLTGFGGNDFDTTGWKLTETKCRGKLFELETSLRILFFGQVEQIL
jgi:hypothetical protein